MHGQNTIAPIFKELLCVCHVGLYYDLDDPISKKGIGKFNEALSALGYSTFLSRINGKVILSLVQQIIFSFIVRIMLVFYFKPMDDYLIS